MNKKICLILFIFSFPALLTGCAGIKNKEQSLTAFYSMNASGIPYSPVFEVHGYENEHNRIGSPSASIKDGEELLRIDTSKPSVFIKEVAFKTGKGNYRNLVYRIHFPLVPFFHLTAGNNPGLLVIVTMSSDEKPLLVTTVHTCGCYNAIIPTNYLADNAYPDGWKKEPFDLYGETLPGVLDFSGINSPSILVKIRPDVHRAMDIRPVESEGFHRNQDNLKYIMDVNPMSELERIPAGDGKTANFFHEDGVMKGHVKDTIKPLEMIFMSIISLDLYVGSDKIYSPPDNYGNPFYTSLKPWYRDDSDMRDFAKYLKFWGWKL